MVFANNAFFFLCVKLIGFSLNQLLYKNTKRFVNKINSVLST